LFKHALVQDAAYGTLLREPRRALHARIAETLESQFAEIAQNQPELLAHHCAEAGLMEKAANFWGKAGQRSLDRSALAEAIEQFTRALDAIATLPSSPALRREQIRLQIALIPPLSHAKGHAAPETKAAIERARLLIEQTEAVGEPPEDPLLLFAVLLGSWVSRFATFDGTAMCELAEQFLALAERQTGAAPQMIGHRIMGASRLCTGDPANGRAHCNRAVALYNPVRDRPLATRFATDNRVSSLAFGSVALWLLGFPDAAREDIAKALEDARDIRHAGSLMTALAWAPLVHTQCGDYAVARTEVEELAALANEKGAAVWKAFTIFHRGYLLSLIGPASEAAFVVTSGIDAMQSTGATLLLPLHLAYLSKAQAEMRQFENAWDSISRALVVIETTNERWFESEVNRRAGDVAALMPPPDEAMAEAYFERALNIARAQQAKSLELRAAMSMARLWRDQGKPQQARELLAPVYGWFMEGFDTCDLKEAKALLDALSS
jgi:predicted ATPase